MNSFYQPTVRPTRTSATLQPKIGGISRSAAIIRNAQAKEDIEQELIDSINFRFERAQDQREARRR